MANIKNLCEFPIQIGGVSISPRGTALIKRWDVLQNSDQSKALLNAKAIEVVEEEQKSKKTKKGNADGVSDADA
jgi:hypothetical protein